jgi:hypothetical protein
MNKLQYMDKVQDSVSEAVGIDITHLLYYSIYESLYERVLYLVRNSLFYKTYDFLNDPTCIFIKISVMDKFGDKK